MVIFPIDSYSHDSGDGQSLTLGPMYRGCENPNYFGWLIFGDYVSGYVKTKTCWSLAKVYRINVREN